MNEENKKVEPMEFCVPMKDVIESIDGGNFKITSYQGGIEYSVFNSYHIFVKQENSSLYQALQLLMRIHKGEYEQNDEDTKNYCIGFSLIMNQILQLPIIASANEKLMLDVGELITKYFNEMQKKINEAQLKEDDNPEQTQALNDAVIATNIVADELKSASQELKNGGGNG